MTTDGNETGPAPSGGTAEGRETLSDFTDAAATQTSVGSTPGAPTWPMAPGQSAPGPVIPPVGLNWAAVANQLGIDLEVLLHEGQIITIGETFPEAGHFIDPDTLLSRVVDVGQFALRRGYFLGSLSLRDFHVDLAVDPEPSTAEHPVMREDSGPIIGLFGDAATAEEARDRLMQGSLGSGITIGAGPLGTELRVGVTELPGRVATVIAGAGGAVISIAGEPVRASAGGEPLATGRTGSGDERRGGTGAVSDSPAPASRGDQSEVIRDS